MITRIRYLGILFNNLAFYIRQIPRSSGYGKNNDAAHLRLSNLWIRI